MKKPKCLICKKDIESSVRRTDSMTDDEYLEMNRSCPNNAVVFTGGANFGSSITDAIIDGVELEIIICDDCIKERMDMVEKITYHKTCTKVYVDDQSEEKE